MADEELVAAVERDAHALALSVRAAHEAGVSEALIFPALVSVFREAGLLPEGFDFASLLGMLA